MLRRDWRQKKSEVKPMLFAIKLRNEEETQHLQDASLHGVTLCSSNDVT